MCYDLEWFIVPATGAICPGAVLHSVLRPRSATPAARRPGRQPVGLALILLWSRRLIPAGAIPDPSGGLAAGKNLPGTAQNGAMPAAGPIYRWLTPKSLTNCKSRTGNLCEPPPGPGATAPASRLRCRAAAGNSLGAKPSACSAAGQQAGQAAGAGNDAGTDRSSPQPLPVQDFLRRFAVMREEPRLDP